MKGISSRTLLEKFAQFHQSRGTHRPGWRAAGPALARSPKRCSIAPAPGCRPLLTGATRPRTAAGAGRAPRPPEPARGSRRAPIRNFRRPARSRSGGRALGAAAASPSRWESLRWPPAAGSSGNSQSYLWRSLARLESAVKADPPPGEIARAVRMDMLLLMHAWQGTCRMHAHAEEVDIALQAGLKAMP